MYGDLRRPPLSERSLRTGLIRTGSLWTDVRVVAATGSTNADLLAAARAGADEGLVLVAESQTAGRGRLDRVWTAPPRAGLTVSVLLRPVVPPGRRAWLPLLAGVALATAVSRLAEVSVRLKWPNDLLAAPEVRPAGGPAGRPGKVAGILAEAVGDAVVVGFGLNVTTTADELPGEAATSLALAGGVCLDRDPLLRAVLRGLDEDYLAWERADGDPEASGLRARYVKMSDTLGRDVRVTLPGERLLTGRAVDIDQDGCLVVETVEGARATVAAGDVVHVR